MTTDTTHTCAPTGRAGRHRSRSRSHGRRGAAVLAVLAAAGCLAEATSVTTAAAARHAAGVPVAARAAAIALEEGVEVEALDTEAVSGVGLPAADAAVARLARAVAVDAAGWQALAVPAADRTDLRSTVSADMTLARSLATTARSTSLAALRHSLDVASGSTAAARLSLFNASQNRLLGRLGAPLDDPWWGPQRPGRTIYSDDFTSPASGWLLGPNVRYGKGYLAVTAAPHRGGSSAPHTAGTFDSSEITVEVQARPATGAGVLYGLTCPGTLDRPRPYAIVGSDGSWYLGLTSYGAGGRAYGYYGSAKPGDAIRRGEATNLLRLDCQQYAPGLSSARLYVNGRFVAEQSFPTGIPNDINPGVQVVNEVSTAATVDYSGWRVSALPAPTPPPLAIPG